MNSINIKKAPLNFGRSGRATKQSIKKLNSTTLHTKPEKDNPNKEPFILIEYIDWKEHIQRRIIKRNNAFMFNQVYEQRINGITQKEP